MASSSTSTAVASTPSTPVPASTSTSATNGTSSTTTPAAVSLGSPIVVNDTHVTPIETRPPSASIGGDDGGEDKSKLTKNKKINRKHPEFELTYDMMLGIRTTVGQTESKPLKEKLSGSDMRREVKLRFPHGGSSSTPAHQMRDFKFKDYAPDVFRAIRARFGVSAADYLLCVCGNFQYLEFISNSKSGQFFFYSHDRRYMIKTVSSGECKFLRNILEDYYTHLMKNPNTLLTRFYGMHRVKPHKKKEVHFLIMGSVFYTQRQIHRTFDLKGSKQGRNATAKEKLSPSCVYKDNDFLEQGVKLNIDAGLAEVLRQQIARDVEFLSKLKIMDYSLLLGVNDLKQQAVEDKRVEDDRRRREGRAAGGASAATTPLPDNRETKVRFDLTANTTSSSAVITPAATSTSSSTASTIASASATSTSTTTTTTISATTAPTASTDATAATTSTGAAAPTTPTITATPAATTNGAVAHAPDTAEVKVAAESKSSGDPSTMVIEDGKDPLLDLPAGTGERRQTRYGLPKRYNAFSRPQDIDFVAPEFAAVQLRPTTPAKKPIIEPVVSLFTRDDGGTRGMKDGRPTDEVYYMGVIDILTEYGVKKKMEYQAKSLKYDKNDISAVNPSAYANRFKEFMSKAIAS